MNLNQPSLVLFEESRKANNLIPPLGSNSFYMIGNGRINLSVKRADPDNYRFDLFTDSGEVAIGDSPFHIAGDINNTEFPYANLTVVKNTAIIVSDVIGISKGTLEVYGIMRIVDNGHINIRNAGKVILHKDSDLVIKGIKGIHIDDGSSMIIYGRIHVDVNTVDMILNAKNITIDPAAVLIVAGLESLGQRLYSLTDYCAELRNQIINVNTQGEKNFIRGIGRLGYVCKYGDPLSRYQVLQLSVSYGEAVLGDFKFSVLGRPKELVKNSQFIETLIIEKGSSLHITDSFAGYNYIHAELYIGAVIGNSKTAGLCVVKGSMDVSGENSSITIDRGSILWIDEDATVDLHNHAIIRSTNHGNSPVLFINGILIIDDISQIGSFTKQNISFGNKGKIIIRNPDTESRRVLLSIPNGIKTSELYRLFGDRLDKVEYHISNNTGIEIDQFYEFYHKDFLDWYGGMTIEKAIHTGLVVWHHGGFIKLKHSVIPWVNEESTLLHASRIFVTNGSFDNERLQEVANKLRYAGSGNMVFVFEADDSNHEVTLTLDSVHIKNTINNPLSNTYVVSTDNSGELFMRNKLAVVSPEMIISKTSSVIPINDNIANVNLP